MLYALCLRLETQLTKNRIRVKIKTVPWHGRGTVVKIGFLYNILQFQNLDRTYISVYSKFQSIGAWL
jgi:hypothetical protein